METKLLNIMDTVMRVPPLFIMDEVIRWCSEDANSQTTGFAIRNLYNNIVEDSNHYFMENAYIVNESTTSKDVWEPSYQVNFTESDDGSKEDEDDLFRSWLPILFKIMFSLTAYIIAIIMFLLNWKRLVQVYMLLGSIAIILGSYHANMVTVHFMSNSITEPSVLQNLLNLNLTDLWNNGSALFVLSVNYFLQSLLGILFTSLHLGDQNPVLKYIIVTTFMCPTCCLLLPIALDIQKTIPVFTALIPLAVIKYVIATNLYNCINILVEGYKYGQMFLNTYGLHALLESQWIRLNVPNVLRSFWITQVVHHMTVILGEYMYVYGEYKSIWNLDTGTLYMMFKTIMTQGCETSVAVLGMSSVISYICHYIGVVFQLILMSDDEEERSLGTVCAILFFVLAEQSGLTGLEGEKRFVRLCRNFCLLLTAMLHFIQNMVSPVLMSLSASHNPAVYRHARALFVCFILILLPTTLVTMLWLHNPLSTWILAVSAFSIQVIVKTVVSLLIYVLFLIDAYRATFWERLDDYVYYIKAFGNTVEFIFGILLFFNGAWIYFFESGGAIRAFMMCIHAYFNIWCEAKNGWSVFVKRKTAVIKIDSLPDADVEELKSYNDVCAICFQDLQSAKLTQCKHYFHSVCLRKWLYIQDSCPLCHKILFKTDTKEIIEDNNTDDELNVIEEEDNRDVESEEDDFQNVNNEENENSDNFFEVDEQQTEEL